jgi:hypothetical protein
VFLPIRQQEVTVVIAFLLIAVSAVVVVACHQRAREQGWEAPAARGLRRRRALPTRPPEDRAPAGLTPLVPSPRALASEFERGLRELTLFLAFQGRD